MQKNDPARAKRIGQRFLDAYPDFDMLFIAPDGLWWRQLGCDDPPSNLNVLPPVVGDVLTGKQFRGLIEHGCEKPGPKVPPSYTVALPVEGGGAVVLCLPYSVELLDHTASKLHMELSLITPDDKIISATKGYPVGGGLRKSARSRHGSLQRPMVARGSIPDRGA